MAKPRFPGKPQRLLSRNRTRIPTFSNPHDDDTLDVIGNICFGLGVFKHSFPDCEEPHLLGCNDFKGFTTREISASKSYAKRKYEEAKKRDFKHSSAPNPLFTPIPLNITPTIEGPKNEKEDLDDGVIGVPSSKKARRKGGGRKSISVTPKQESPAEDTGVVSEIKQEKPEPAFTPVASVSQEKQESSGTGVSLLPSAESPLSWVGHPLIVEGKRRWKPTYKVLQGPSVLEESRRLGGEAWPLGARQMGRAVEAPAPLGGKFVTGSGEKEHERKGTWKSCSSSSNARPSGGGILREARLRLDSAATGTEDGEWVRRMMDDTDKNKPSVPDLPKPASQSSAIESGSPDKSVPESEISRVYCRICKGAMSRRFSKRKMGKRGVWSCKACREFAAEMTKKLRNNKNAEGSNEAPPPTITLTCRGGKGKCQDEENWPPAPPQRCVPCWLRLCLNAPPPHLIPCPVSRAALRKQLPVYGAQPPKEPGKRGKKRRGSKFVHLKSKRQKVAAEGPRVKHVCRSALAVLGRPPATFPAREPLKTQGGEASTGQESSMCTEVKEAEGSAKKQEGGDKLLEGNEASSPPPPPVNSSGGAHQWWKQRKGMHRRRKKGRLSLALPRRDGRLPLHRPIPKSPPVVKPPHLAKVTKDVGPPLKLEGYPFRADAAEVFTNGYGVIQVAPNIMPIKPVCFLCGSGGKQWLVHCALCCEPFHTFCVEWAGWDIFDGWDVPSTGPPKGFKSLEWMCRRCSLCHACGLPAYMPGGGMPSVTAKKKLKAIEKKGEEDGEKKKKKDDEDEEMEDMGTRTCNLCHRCYHGACLGSATENQKSNDFALFKDRETPWVCSSCIKCHSCGKPAVAGSVPKRSSERMKEGEHAEPESGPEDLLLCAQCLSLHRKGNYCPLCHVVYRDTDFDALMMQCAQCSSWVHASCEGLTDDQYHLLSLLPSSIEFTCSPCTTTPHPAWRKALEKKLRQGLERILEILVEAVNARKSSSLPPPLSPGIPPEPSTCYSDIPMESFEKKLENLPKNVDRGDSSGREFANGCPCPDDALEKKSKESDAVDYCNSGKSDINNEESTKVSIVLDKSVKVASAKAANLLLELKKRISFGDFSDPSDFSKAVQCYFQDDELVISTLRGALAKVFPSVKPKFFPRDVSKKIELLLTDHSYTCTSKTSDLLKRLPKVEDKENDTKNIASGENNIKFTFSCDLKSNAEGSEKASDKNCALKELGENTSKSKECPTQKENLWMDPSDYIPNLKVYSFASALRRRSRNNTVLRLSTKDFEPKSKPMYTPSEKELNMTLENSRSIVTYKSVLAGIKKECSESDISANEQLEKSNDEKKVVDESKEISAPQEQQTVPECAKSETVEEGIAESLQVSKENDNQNCCRNEVLVSEVGGSLSEVNSSKDDQKVDACDIPQNTSMHCIGVEEIRSGVDARRCLFCHVRGDADVEREGRLLLASSFGDWVHCNCALWSAEVYEEKGGLLMKVREAVNRGRRVRCALCRETGATLGCCLRGCPDSFHLGCAFRSGCLLLEDKSVYCRNHIPADKAKESNVEMSLKRPVQVDTEGRKGSVLWRWKKPGRAKRKPGDNGTTFAAGSLKFTVGSLHVECLGKIVPGNVQGQFIRPPEGKKSDNEGEMRWCEGGVSLAKKEEKDSKVPEMMAYGGPVVVPVGFRCTRLYWSSVEPWKVIEYNIQTVLVISETDEAQLAVTEEKEEKQNEEHDFHAHVTVDHTAEAEDDSRGAEQTDLIIPSDNELVKDLPSDFFPSKKLMQSIVGLLKGANNGEIQNGVPHHTFEVGETQKNLSDKENSISPNGSSLSDQNIQVPRHNKPMNVVQPVSKETLLTAESASRAWELTCEMRAAQTPPPSASPTMTGAAGNTSGISSIIKSQNKPEIWSEGSKELWKHLRPISQLDGNADPSSSSSEGGGSSPVRSSPSREPDQALPCLLACRIKQQSLARSEPGGGGPVKCKDCRRTYRTREGYERHLCGTPLPLSSTSSDSDSEDRTSRRVSSESDVPNVSEDTVPQANDMYECYNECSGKEKTLDENLNTKTDDDHTSCLIDNAAFNKDFHAEKFSPITNEEVSVNHMALNTTETCQSKVVATASFVSNPIDDGALMGDESQNVETNCSSSDQSKELNTHSGENDNIYPSEDDTSAMNSTKSEALDSNCSNIVSSEIVGKNSAKNTLSNLVQDTKEVREGVWKGSTSDVCTNKSTKRQMAKVQPVCYVNGTRRIQSAELLEASKAARLTISQEETLICNNQQINQGGIPQTSIITAPIQPQGSGNFQVLVRQLPSSSAVPQFAENFRQQTGHTLQYLATIDPNTFTQPGPLTQPQNLVGLIQGAPQIMQTQTLVSSQQVVASSPIMLAPQQQAIVYNPVTACIEALPPQQPNYILTPSTYTIPVSTPLSYGIPQEVSQVYFQSTAQTTVPSQPQAPQLEPVIQNEVGWTLPSGYHIVQNHPVEQHPQTVIQPQQLPQVIASSVPSTVEEDPLSGPVAQMLTVPIQSSPSTAKKKRILLPNNKVREGYMAYRRDDRTGKYIPVEEGWEESLGLPIQKKVIEDGGVRSGLSPAVFPIEGKDCSSKDGRKPRPIARKSEGMNLQGAESVDSQGSPKRWVRAKLTSQFRSPSNSACDSFEPIADPTNPNFRVVNRTRSAVEQVSLGTERVPKRVESASIMYQIRSADGLTIQSDSPDKMWNQVFNSVQEARVAYGLAPLPRNPFAPIYGSKPFMGAETLALSHKGLRYLLNQLPGASQLLETKQSAPEVPSVAPPPHKLFSRAHLSLSTQTPVEEMPSIPPPPSSPPLPENPSGCARTEAYKMPPPLPGGHSSAMGNRKWRHRDIFGWLASPHRKLPMAPLPTQDSEPNGGGNRRATSLDLPMAMRFRHLKETSRETVGVYRSHIHGRGLFCLKDIEAGEMVIEYSGEVIRSSLTDTREKTYEAKGMGCYMFRIDEQTVVDATMRGNAARFINHSCDPNCYSRVVDILGKKHILIFALRRIPRGEELTYDYKFPFEDVKIPCHCTSKRCRKYLN